MSLPEKERPKTDPIFAPWSHVDQSPLRKNLQCVQGILNLLPNGPEDGGLMVLAGSSQHYTELWDHFDHKKGKDGWNTWEQQFLDEEMCSWLENEKGCKWVKVCCQPGDLLLWDSVSLGPLDARKQSSQEERRTLTIGIAPHREQFTTARLRPRPMIDLLHVCLDSPFSLSTHMHAYLKLSRCLLQAGKHGFGRSEGEASRGLGWKALHRSRSFHYPPHSKGSAGRSPKLQPSYEKTSAGASAVEARQAAGWA